MAKTKASKKENKPEFKEFKFSEDIFDYTGRIYPWEETGSTRRAYLSLCMNDAITVNYCHLVETKEHLFISFPSIKSKEDYKSIIFTDEDLKTELDKIAGKLKELLDK